MRKCKETEHLIKPTFTKEELHELYDMLYIMEAGIIEINNLQKSYNSIFEKLDKYCIAELEEQEE